MDRDVRITHREYPLCMQLHLQGRSGVGLFLSKKQIRLHLSDRAVQSLLDTRARSNG